MLQIFFLQITPYLLWKKLHDNSLQNPRIKKNYSSTKVLKCSQKLSENQTINQGIYLLINQLIYSLIIDTLCELVVPKIYPKSRGLYARKNDFKAFSCSSLLAIPVGKNQLGKLNFALLSPSPTSMSPFD